MKKPLIIAHRGASGEAPENTLAAFQKAVDQGADAVELDVHLSLDGAAVVCHDDRVDRTTNGSGLISQMSWKELQELDAGSWFGEEYAGETIPSLEQVLDLLPESMIVNIEIKNLPMFYQGIEERVAGILSTQKNPERFVVSSFDHDSLNRFQALAPNIKTGLLYSCNLLHADRYAGTFNRPVYSLHPYKGAHSWDIVAGLLKSGLQLYVWTVDEASEMEEWTAAGVSGIITNYPGRLSQMLNRNTGSQN